MKENQPHMEVGEELSRKREKQLGDWQRTVAVLVEQQLERQTGGAKRRIFANQASGPILAAVD